MEKIYDVAILGAGPAGLTAAIYSARGNWKTVMLEKMGAGGQLAITDDIENYPGFPEGINGFELSQKMEEQAKKFGAEFQYVVVESVEKNSDGIFEITTDSDFYKAKTVITTLGVSPRKLNVPGEQDFIGKGISFCATCDGAFYKEKVVAVVGGGDAAVEEAIFLTRFAKKVYIIHRRDALRAVKVVQERAFKNDKIEIVWDSVVEEVIGDNTLTAVKLKNVKDNTISTLDVDGMFIYIGGITNAGCITNVGGVAVNKDEKGYIYTDVDMCTNIKGLFAAGDCRVKSLRQVSTAVGDGAIAADSANKYLDKLEA